MGFIQPICGRDPQSMFIRILNQMIVSKFGIRPTMGPTESDNVFQSVRLQCCLPIPSPGKHGPNYDVGNWLKMYENEHVPRAG